MKSICCLAPFVLWLTACGEPNVLDVGDEKGQLGEALTDYAAGWDGYAQAFAFGGDETDRVRLTLDQNGEGTIRFGEEELFAPATDPDALHPPTYPPEYAEIVVFEPTSDPDARSGFEYPIIGAQVEDARLRFEFNPRHFMESWCQLQADSLLPEWTCGSGGWSSSLVDGEFECAYHDEDANFYSVPCHRAAQCQACTCDEDTCHARTDDVIRFDGVLSDDGQTLTGTLLMWGDPGERITIVLTQ